MNFKEIYEGWRNRIFPPNHLKEYIQRISDERLAKCLPCKHNTTEGRINNISACKVCGCPLKTKTKALHSECPLPFPLKEWVAVATPEQSQEIIKEITEHNES